MLDHISNGGNSLRLAFRLVLERRMKEDWIVY